MSDDNTPRAVETADAIRTTLDLPPRWGEPEGEPGTPERRAWVTEHIKADLDEAGK